jgi:Family of unknown function (DUF5670)
MLYTIAVVLLILWLLGLVTSYTLGGFIHILLVVAVIMILLNLITGRRALWRVDQSPAPNWIASGSPSCAALTTCNGSGMRTGFNRDAPIAGRWPISA